MDPILIVDDEKDNLDALKRMLRGQYDVSIAESAAEGLRLLQSQTFHIIISDQRMPSMTGVEFLERAKKLSPLSTRILLTGYTDIDSVIEAINRAQIYRYLSKPWEPEDFRMTLRAANETFLLKKEIEEKNQVLEKALHELTLLDRAKSRFLSLISHELNTPLTILNSFIEFLSERKSELPADFEKAITLIQGASDRLSEMVQDILEYIRLETQSSIQQQEVNIAEILTGIVAELEPKSQKKNVRIQMGFPSHFMMSVDPEKFRLALLHCMKDTISRSPQHSTVEVILTQNQSEKQIEIVREGEPINEQAFQLLETGQSEMKHHQNLGLDLALCHKIVTRHEGQLSIEIAEPKVKLKIALGHTKP